MVPPPPVTVPLALDDVIEPNCGRRVRRHAPDEAMPWSTVSPLVPDESRSRPSREFVIVPIVADQPPAVMSVKPRRSPFRNVTLLIIRTRPEVVVPTRPPMISADCHWQSTLDAGEISDCGWCRLLVIGHAGRRR